MGEKTRTLEGRATPQRKQKAGTFLAFDQRERRKRERLQNQKACSVGLWKRKERIILFVGCRERERERERAWKGKRW